MPQWPRGQVWDQPPSWLRRPMFVANSIAGFWAAQETNAMVDRVRGWVIPRLVRRLELVVSGQAVLSPPCGYEQVGARYVDVR